MFDFLKKPKEEILTTHGTTGTNLQSGMLSEEYNSDLLFPQSIEIFDEMRKSDSTIIAILRAIKQPLTSAKWQIQAGGEEKQDQDIANFVRKNLFENVKFKHFLRESLGFLDFGFYYFEKIYQIVDGKIEWKELSPRVPRSHYLWSISGKEWTEGHPAGVTQQTLSTDEGKSMTNEIPWDKIILFSYEKEGNNFEGVSILRNAYKHYFYKNLLYKIESISAERYGVGVPYAKTKGSITEAKKTALVDFLKNIRSNEQSYGVVTEEVELLEILTPAGTGVGASIQQAIAHHDRKIYDSILAGFLNLTTGEGGSNALSKDQSSFFLRGLQGIADFYIDVINEHIKELVNMNWNGIKNYPKLTVSDIGSISMDEVINSIGSALEKGMVEINQNDKNDIRAILKLSPLPPLDDEDIELDKLEVEIDLEKMRIDTLQDMSGGDNTDTTEQEQNQKQNQNQTTLHDIFESYEYKYVITQEHKDKIGKAIAALKVETKDPDKIKVKSSQDLIAGDSEVKKYEQERVKLKSMADGVKTAMETLKAKRSSLSKEDKKKYKDEFKTKLDELKKSRESLENLSKQAKGKKSERESQIREYRKEAVEQVGEIKKTMKTKERETKKAEREKVRSEKKAAKEAEKAKKKAERETKKKNKKLSEGKEPTEREVIFTDNITKFEDYLEEKYSEMEEMVIEAEQEYQDALEELYDQSESKRVDGVVCLVYDKKMINKGQKLVEKITAKLQEKLIDSPLQDEIFKEAIKQANTTLGDNEQLLAYKAEIAKGQIDTFIEGYRSNMQGVIYNESRRVLENITLNYGSEASVELAKNTASEISINKNILILSFITHPRALFKYAIYNEAQSKGFTMFKTIVPTDKLSNVIDRPFGMTASLIFTIKTAAQINQAASAATAGKTAEAVTGLGLHHGSFEYYYPIGSADLDMEEGIAKQQRDNLQQQMDLNK